jgi:LPS O-antigen subunit length determinant protein (WzzB/FepE family)
VLSTLLVELWAGEAAIIVVVVVATVVGVTVSFWQENKVVNNIIVIRDGIRVFIQFSFLGLMKICFNS